MKSNAKMPKTVYGHGGGMMMKKPMPENYIGNPMGYFNDMAMYGNKEKKKAMYGTEKMMKAQDGKAMDEIKAAADKAMETTKSIQDLRQQRLDAKLKRKQTRAKIRDAQTSGGVRGTMFGK